jgi:hypothetical protein
VARVPAAKRLDNLDRQKTFQDDGRAQLVVCAQVQNVFAVENFSAGNIEKVHNRFAARIVFET